MQHDRWHVGVLAPSLSGSRRAADGHRRRVPWFQPLAIAASAGLIAAAYRWRVDALARRALWLETQVTARTADLASRTAELEQANNSLRREIAERAEVEARLRLQADLLGHVRNGVIATDPDGKVIYWNRHAEEMYGWLGSEAVGRSLAEVNPSTFTAETGSAMVARLSAGESWSGEFTGRHKDGSTFPAYVSIVPISFAGDRRYGVVGVSVDISDRKRAEEALAASEARLRSLIHHFPDGAVLLFDSALRLQIVDGNGLDQLGAVKDAEGKSLREALPSPIAAAVDGLFAAAKAGVLRTDTIVPFGGRFLSLNLVALEDEHGAIASGMVVTQDVTERRQYEQAILRLNSDLEARVVERTADLTASLRTLEQSQRFSEQLAATSPALLLLYDLPSAQIVFANRGVVAALGGDPNDTRLPSSDELRALLHPDDIGLLNAEVLRTALASGNVAEYELRMRDSGQGWRWFAIRSSVFARAPDGEITQVLVAALDVTGRRQVEDELRAYHRRLLQVQDAERAHLARELHDQVGQILTGLNLTLQSAASADADTMRRRIAAAQVDLSNLTGLVRQLSLDLRPAMLEDLGLLPALVWQTQRFSERTGLRVNVQHGGLDVALASETAMTAYRVAQEALTNVARHAGVEEARLQLWTAGSTLYVQVIDHGRGFDPAEAFRQPGSGGLLGMRERVRLIGGTLSIESGPGAGTEVLVELPLDLQAEPNGSADGRPLQATAGG